MHKGRLEAFSDGVIAIIITIMVLEFKVPPGPTFADLFELAPVFLSYILSFVYVGIYWINHHHLLQITKKVDGPVLLANMHLLFWLSLIPFATNWMHEGRNQPAPVATYGIVLFLAGAAYTILTWTLLRAHPKDSTLHKAIGSDFKGKISVVAYLVAISAAYISVYISIFVYIAVAIMWIVPDRRIERIIE